MTDTGMSSCGARNLNTCLSYNSTLCVLALGGQDEQQLSHVNEVCMMIIICAICNKGGYESEGTGLIRSLDLKPVSIDPLDRGLIIIWV